MKSCTRNRKVKCSSKGKNIHSDTIFQTNGIWMNREVLDVLISESPNLVNEDAKEKFRNEAESLYRNACECYKSKKLKDLDFKWTQKILSSGTFSDKIAAYTVLVTEDPICSLNYTAQLISLVTIKSQRECLIAMDALKDIFLNHLLPPERKLKSFDQQSLNILSHNLLSDKIIKERLLILWYYEMQLKREYLSFIHALEKVSRSASDFLRLKAVKVLFELLANHPEQEQILLSKLTNKLGDPHRKVASQAYYLLLKLLEKHTAMKGVIVTEIEKFVYRARAQYLGLGYLSQILLDPRDTKIASSLIRIYLGFFKLCIKHGEVDGKIMSILLSGVNRAYPYVQGEMSSLSEHIQTIYKVIHMVPFNTAVQGLCLLQRLLDSQNNLSDRFYTAVYRKLLDPELTTCSRQPVLFKLLCNMMKHDESLCRVQVFTHRLLQLPAHLACSILNIISEVVVSHPKLLTVDKKFLDDEDEKFIDADKEDVKKFAFKNVKKVLHPNDDGQPTNQLLNKNNTSTEEQFLHQYLQQKTFLDQKKQDKISSLDFSQSIKKRKRKHEEFNLEETDESEDELPDTQSMKRHSQDKLDVSKMFASAEQFGSLLEENFDMDLSISNHDAADPKQLLWEQKKARQKKRKC